MSEICMRDAEVELMSAAYGDCYEVVQTSEGGDAVFDISVHEAYRVKIRFFVASDFPETPIRYRLDGKISSSQKQILEGALRQLMQNDSETGAMQLCQVVQDKIQEWEDSNTIEDVVESVFVHEIARVLIYFHHIMSSTKRRLIKEYAEDLHLGGYSKTGFPGVVVVEGGKENVLEYVRRLQRLRWQHMVVRGEMVETVEGDMDTYRMLPLAFEEFKEGSMSEIATVCRKAGLHDLFMTAMKKQPQSEGKDSAGGDEDHRGKES